MEEEAEEEGNTSVVLILYLRRKKEKRRKKKKSKKKQAAKDEGEEENKRIKRANSPPPLTNPRTILLTYEMGDKTFVGYGPCKGPHNIATMSLQHIVQCIDQVFLQWHLSTGFIH